MSDAALKTLSDLATDAHTRIQQGDSGINPVIGLRRGQRESDFPADVITIDCLQTRKRIVLILHDQHPGTMIYQFAMIDGDSEGGFQQMPFENVSAEILHDWMTEYFSSNAS